MIAVICLIYVAYDLCQLLTGRRNPQKNRISFLIAGAVLAAALLELALSGDVLWDFLGCSFVWLVHGCLERWKYQKCKG